MAIFKLRHRLFINTRMLARIAGWLLLIEGAFLLIPTATALTYEESDWLPFAATSAVTLLAGFILARFSRPTSTYMGKRDGYLLTAMVWVVFSLFGMIPFLFCSTHASLTDAFFEAMSGFTTTGASVLDGDVAIGHGIHIWRALMQWIGGMGIILFTLAVIPMLNHSGGMQMFNAEVTGITHDKIQPRISQTAKSLWLIYIGLTAILILLLRCGPMNLFDSFCHAFGTISTGGYSSNPDGIASWTGSLYVKAVLIVFMFLGGVNFALIFKCLRGNFSSVRHNDVLKTYVGTIAVMLVLFSTSILLRGQAADWVEAVVDPLFQIVSTITSTGFSTAKYETWGPFVLALTFIMMFSGACAGSTSGGAKIDRMIFLIKNSRNEVYRGLFPNSILSVKVNDRVVNPELVNKVVAFLCIYMMLVVVGGTVLSAVGVPTIDAFFTSFSCLSNTGLDASITGYGNPYSILPDTAKWVLTFLMLTGRLEIFTILILFTPAFWRK